MESIVVGNTVVLKARRTGMNLRRKNRPWIVGERCDGEFIKWMGTNSWLPFWGNRHFVRTVVTLFGMYVRAKKNIASHRLRIYVQTLLDAIFDSRVRAISKYLVNGSMLELMYIFTRDYIYRCLSKFSAHRINWLEILQNAGLHVLGIWSFLIRLVMLRRDLLVSV